jgi:hypothetical protein
VVLQIVSTTATMDDDLLAALGCKELLLKTSVYSHNNLITELEVFPKDFHNYLRMDHYTGCLIKNASTHNFFIYYPISMNKKTEDMVFSNFDI